MNILTFDLETNTKKVHGRTANPCIEFAGTLSKKGYGVISICNKTFYVHRLIYKLFNGDAELMPGLIIRHICDNPKCINPTHLEQGTASENSNDMVQRGRSTYGERNFHVKLTEEQVLQIRKDLYLFNNSELSRKYKVSKETIRNIRLNKTWKYLI